MEFKERMVHFLEEASERLRLGYQPTLQAIQALNILDHPRSHPPINKIVRTLPRAHCLAAAILALTSKLYNATAIHMRQLIRVIDPRYRQLGIDELERGSDQPIEIGMTAAQMGELLKQCEMVVMVQLRWKLAVPLLYDEVIAVAHDWDKYAGTLTEFPLRFQSFQEGNCSDNHNYLVRNIRVCLYNFSHLIRNTPLQAVSHRIRKLAQALFLATIKQLLKEQTQTYILSPKVSIAYLLADFFKRSFGVQVEEVAGEVLIVTEVLTKYRQFRERSKQRGKKTAPRSNKHSQDKQNVGYYVSRQKNGSKIKLKRESDQRSTKLKSRSRSKLEKGEKSKLQKADRTKLQRGDRAKLTSSKWESRDGTQLKSKQSVMLVVKNTHKKSSSTKSIHPHKEEPLQQQKKTIKFSKSRASKRSEKSQLNSKIIPSCTLQQNFTSKSTYWLKPSLKTDKKSTNSIRMKLR